MNNPFEDLKHTLDNILETQKILLSRLNDRSAQADLNPHERLTRKEVYQQYKISYPTIHSLMRLKKLPYDKVGRKTLFRRTDVERCFSSK